MTWAVVGIAVSYLPANFQRKLLMGAHLPLCLLAGPALDKIISYATETGIVLLWISAIVTLYTGYDYFRAGVKYIVDE